MNPIQMTIPSAVDKDTDSGMMEGMDDLQLVLNELDRTPLSAIKDLGKRSGVPKDTLIKIKYRTTKNPRWKTITALAAHFKKHTA